MVLKFPAKNEQYPRNIEQSFSKIKEDMVERIKEIKKLDNKISEIGLRLDNILETQETINTKMSISILEQIKEIKSKIKQEIKDEIKQNIKEAVIKDIKDYLKVEIEEYKKEIKEVIKQAISETVNNAIKNNENINTLNNIEVNHTNNSASYEPNSPQNNMNPRIINDMNNIHHNLNPTYSANNIINQNINPETSEWQQFIMLKKEINEIKSMMQNFQMQQNQLNLQQMQNNFHNSQSNSYLNRNNFEVHQQAMPYQIHQQATNDNYHNQYINREDKLKREMLRKFEKNKKEIIKNKIKELLHNKSLKLSELKYIIVEQYGYCSKASFYRYYNELKEQGLVLEVKKEGKIMITVSD